MTKLRIGLTISGAVSLGAYEGGALAALLVALRRRPDALAIDAIAGASAGAITGLLAAHCIVTGDDPVPVMSAAWVEVPALDALRSDDLSAPLSSDGLAEFGRSIFSRGPSADGAQPSTGEVTVSLAVVSLGGLGYRIAQPGGRPPVDAVTYLDWSTRTFSAATSRDEWLAAMDASLTSGANAVGFPPRVFHHSPAEIAEMVANGVTNADPAGSWYTDGGTINNEPFGRLLGILGHEDADDHRVVMLIHPSPVSLPAASVWTDRTCRPAWARTAYQAQHLQNSQSVFDDLQRLSKTNRRLDWIADLAASLATGIERAVGDGDGSADALERVRAAVIESIDRVDQHRANLRTEVGRATAQPSKPSASGEAQLAELIERAVRAASGFEGKRQVAVEAVSPALDESGQPADRLLAGDRLGHFFGFLDERFRQSDFNLGWKHMTTWLSLALPARGIDLGTLTTDLAEAHRALPWHDVFCGDVGWEDLTTREKGRTLLIGVHAAHVAEHDLRHWDGTRLDPAAPPAQPDA